MEKNNQLRSDIDLDKIKQLGALTNNHQPIAEQEFVTTQKLQKSSQFYKELVIDNIANSWDLS